MTQPIQEPGPTTRTDAKLTWGSNQLFRRPAPPGSVERPWARAQKTFGSAVQNIPTNSNTDVIWTEYVNLGAGESGEGVFDDDAGGPVEDLIPLLQGIYLVKVGVYWNVTNVGAFAFGISSNNGSVASIEWFYGNTNHTATTHLEFFATSVMHTEGSNTPWSLTLHHRAGSDRGLDAAFLHAVKIADYTGTDWDDGILNPAQP